MSTPYLKLLCSIVGVLTLLVPGLLQFTDISFFSMVGYCKKLRELQIQEWKGYVYLTEISYYQIIEGFLFIYLFIYIRQNIPCLPNFTPSLDCAQYHI